MLKRLKTHFAMILSVGLIAGGASGCSNMPGDSWGMKQIGGGLLGAGAGGFIGSKFGGGSGKLLATGIGAVLGGLLGSEVGKTLDRSDQMYAAQTAQQALDRGRIGEPVGWRNNQSGAWGETIVTRDGYMVNQDIDRRGAAWRNSPGSYGSNKNLYGNYPGQGGGNQGYSSQGYGAYGNGQGYNTQGYGYNNGNNQGYGNQANSGMYCREYQNKITVGGRTETGYGTACRGPDGQWQIINS